MNGPAVSVSQAQADDPQEQWNRVHAQLLKSVADAQAKLLAAQNETSDKLDVVTGALADAVIMKDGLFTYRKEVMAKLDVIVELLKPTEVPRKRRRKR